MALDGDDTSSTVYLDDLVATNPDGADSKAEGDNHIRFVKKVLKNTFPNITGIVLPTQTELNYVDGVGSQLAGITDTATLTNKTLTSPAINGGSLNNTITVNGDLSANSKTITAAELGTLDGSNTATTLQTQITACLPKAGGELSGDIDANNNDIIGIKTACFEAVQTADSSVDWNDGLRQAMALAASTTFTFTAPSGPANLLLVLTPNGYSYSGWPATVDWGNAGAPTASANTYKDIIMFFYDGSKYYGSYLQGYAE